MLAETLNFTRAAERLHMAQPPLSASIRKLEEELGVLLFDRLPQGVRLTAVGEAVLQHARLALFHAEQVRSTAREGAAGAAGVVRLGINGSSSYELVPRLMQAFRAEYPKAVVDVHESTSGELLRRVETRALDLAIVAHPVPHGTTAEVALLRHERLMLAVRADAPLAERTEVTLAELATEPLIIHSRTHAPHMHEIVVRAFRQAGVQPRIVQEAVQVGSMLGLVEGGMGVAFVSGSLAGHISARVKLLALTGPGAQMQVGTALAFLPAALTPTARNFVALARRLVGGAGQQ